MAASLPLRIAAAQSSSLPGDVRGNLCRHLPFVEAAAAEGASLILFPELSLTGYELPLLNRHVLPADAPVLEPLRRLARLRRITVVVGAPVPGVMSGALPAIGAICLGSDGSSAVYRKAFLHAGEERFASPGERCAHCLDFDDERVALAICADTVHAEHPQRARGPGATVYAASVLWSGAGYASDAAIVQGWARGHGMAALVANHGAPSGGFASAGRSALWGPDGKLLAEAPVSGDCLVVAERRDGGWLGTVHGLDFVDRETGEGRSAT
ncbi:carbon-nitrogen hydrolase family protein [Hydrogenophaga flava]|uniref:carbon-nitrogen hydrolase family protein n=1 Tax=Hydrogenophaga flava TaxID=65657 RepID=UPI000825711F|nr:carbon-nitrogen hydrolase family protein [Hydrogenophaga flava]